MTDTLPFAVPLSSPRPRALPDVAYAALPLLHRLRDALRDAARFRDRARDLEARSPARRWGVPRLFFFEPDLQVEWEGVREAGPRLTLPFADEAARRDPAAARAWVAVTELTDDALTVLTASPEARRAARAVPGLVVAAAVLAPDHPRARLLTDLLALVEDEVIRVVHPAARAGFRVTTRGVADVAQFHVLLADAVTGDPARGLLPGPRPDPHVLAACRDRAVDDEPPVAAARFQFHRPDALQPDGSLPRGFAGTDHWLWGPEPLTALPRLGDERTVLIGPPAFPAAWEVERKLKHVNAALEVVEVLTAAEVTAWLGRQVGRELDVGRAAPRRAA